VWQTALVRADMTEEDIQTRIEKRKAARAAKDYAAADAVRIELEEKGVTLMDTPEGTTWRPCPLLEAAE
jgi:cysteinyl-tRNA synthetase